MDRVKFIWYMIQVRIYTDLLHLHTHIHLSSSFYFLFRFYFNFIVIQNIVIFWITSPFIICRIFETFFMYDYSIVDRMPFAIYLNGFFKVNKLKPTHSQILLPFIADCLYCLSNHKMYSIRWVNNKIVLEWIRKV